ncbi:MAG: ATP-binding cassette domain-containing protein [Bacteroidota bacterium]
MQLTLQNVGKHYNHQWLFRNVSFNLNTGESIAILGKNGSGKSTLLQIIFGLVKASEGRVDMDQSIDKDHQYFSLTSPLMALPQEFSINELLAYQQQLKKITLTNDEFLEKAMFSKKEADLQIGLFSSGMQQRLKTALCLFSVSPVKLLDEPLSNMDKDGEIWYSNCMKDVIKGHIVIVASNDSSEYNLIQKTINLTGQ